ncbi:GMC family oxidoreductase [Paraburkholderia tropica]|uniref:GMC family oxidoreductase n=1 Tax=Paraburkholderia tropica TaxID=92647 RepID=UPI002AB5E293|nr:FAD-dependent oxidoreductase [Paraburkholderia tropica]
MTDIVIVGAGTAGCLLADRLSRDGRYRIVLVEAGGDAPAASDVPALWTTLFNGEADWGYHSEPQRGARMRRLYMPRGKMVGGSGAMNAMIYMRGLPSDYERWRAQGCESWGWRDVLPYFRRIEANARLGGSPLHGADGEIAVTDPLHVEDIERAWLDACVSAGYPRNADFNGERQEGVGFFQLNVDAGKRASTAKGMLKRALARPNLQLVTGAQVTRLIVEGQRVQGVAYLKNGVPHELRARRDVVLCAGAIGSPHLMMLSGIGPADELARHGIDVHCDLPGVGQRLADHPQLTLTWASKRPAGIAALGEADRVRALERWRAEGSGPFASNGAIAAGCVRSGADIDEPDLQLYFTLSANRNHGCFLATTPGVSFGVTLQRPKSFGQIRLRSSDPLAHPAIDPGFFSDSQDDDVKTLVRAVRIQRDIASRAPLSAWLVEEDPLSAHCRTDDDIAAFVRAHCVTIFHPSGTCRMGIDALSVVEPHSMKVHGFEGLRVADASVFPSMVSGNLNAPVMMVAEKASDLMMSH